MFFKISALKKFCNIHRKTPVLKVAPRDIAKIEIPHIFVLFYIVFYFIFYLFYIVSYKDFFCPQVF